MRVKVKKLFKIFIVSLTCVCFVVLANGQDKTMIKNEEESKMELWCLNGMNGKEKNLK